MHGRGIRPHDSWKSAYHSSHPKLRPALEEVRIGAGDGVTIRAERVSDSAWSGRSFATTAIRRCSLLLCLEPNGCTVGPLTKVTFSKNGVQLRKRQRGKCDRVYTFTTSGDEHYFAIEARTQVRGSMKLHV